MHRTTMMIAAAVTLAMLPGCGSSNPPKGQTETTGTRTPEEVAGSASYRIGGAALMMTPSQVAAALKAEGYRNEQNSIATAMWQGDSFEDLVEERNSGRPSSHRRRVPTHEEWTKGHETVVVDYSPYPGDSKAITLDWKTDEGSPSEAEIAATLTKRYGPGVRTSKYDNPKWCEPSPCGPGSAKLIGMQREILLASPSVMSQPISLNQRMDAAVRARGGTSKGSF